ENVAEPLVVFREPPPGRPCRGVRSRPAGDGATTRYRGRQGGARLPEQRERKRRRTMAIAERDAEVVWEGGLARGSGSLTSGSGALDRSPVTWAARTEAPNGKTSPEELVAPAHASCFAMALALVLGKENTAPEQLVVRAVCTLDEVAGAPRITHSALEVRGHV